jgi:O-antigen/teichoic acid export membrane protein
MCLISNGAQWGRMQWTALRRSFAGESRRQLMVSISALAGSGLVAVVLRFIGGIVQGRFVGPETLGFYTKFTILPSALFFLHLGVFTSLARQYPYYVGKGERERAMSYAANALGWTWLLSAVHALAFLTPCLWAGWKGDWASALGWGTQSVLSVASLYMFYLGCTYRNSSEFVTWSRATIISAVISILALPLVAMYQFAGLCVRNAFPNIVSTGYAHWKRPLRIQHRFEWNVLWEMMAFGAPLMIFAYISHQLTDATARSFILSELGEKSLGIYAYAGMLCLALTTVSTSISQVFNPRLAMRYGSSSNSMAKTFAFCMKCSLVGTAVMLPLVVLTWWAVDPLVRLLLPKYVECIPITRWLCWLSLIPVIDLPKQLLMVAKRTREFGIAVVVGYMVLLFGGVMITYWDMVTLESIAGVIIFSKIFSVIVSNVFSWRIAMLEQ